MQIKFIFSTFVLLVLILSQDVSQVSATNNVVPSVMRKISLVLKNSRLRSMPLSSVIRLLKNRNPAPGTRAYWVRRRLDSVFGAASSQRYGVRIPSPAIIAQQGYPYEEHFVTTRDGYVLSVHRISGPRGTKSGNANPRRKSVLLIHGLLMSSTGFLALSPQYSLGFILADAGCDVWLGNSRGNTYSRKHAWLNPDVDQSYWHFSQDEMGEYDVPAMIDYILAQTGQSQLIYMGYSQGGRVGFMAATNTTVANKIKLLVSIASTGYISAYRRDDPLINWAANYWRKLEMLGKGEVFQRDLVRLYWTLTACRIGSPLRGLCRIVMLRIWSERIYPEDFHEEDMIPVVFPNALEGSSARQLCQTFQVAFGELQKFDFGVAENRRCYGRATPPVYDLSKILCPVAVYWAENDYTVKIKDVERLEKSLPNLIRNYRVTSDPFDHVDFVYSSKAKELVYPDLLELLRRI
ncbi:lipase 3 [Hyalella azteca]|uniref:Lipase 3 n=1 Tax=Hyalella azteca TaxID=294128 RepID=A0A8B7MZA5_HYAAZ|nr:lipase 3 [Hyalella azteca]